MLCTAGCITLVISAGLRGLAALKLCMACLLILPAWGVVFGLLGLFCIALCCSTQLVHMVYICSADLRIDFRCPCDRGLRMVGHSAVAIFQQVELDIGPVTWSMQYSFATLGLESTQLCA